MVTFQQLRKRHRRKKHHKTKVPALLGNPQKVGIVTQLRIVKPKKPNSAQRKIAQVKFKHRHVLVYIPGQGHNISKHSTVLIRGGRIPDLPGIKLRMIRGALDFTGSEKITRAHRRSKYAIKNPLKKDKDVF